MSRFQQKRVPLRGLVIGFSNLTLLLGCTAVNPSLPGDAAMSCNQIIAEIGQQDATAQLAERRASELRPGYYAFKAVSMLPLIGGVFSMADQFSDLSHSRKLERLDEDAQDAQQRRDYLKGIQSAHCSGLPTTAGVPPAPAITAGVRPPG